MFDTRAFEGIQNLYSPSAFKKIKDAQILVIGIGGVGSWIAESLVRTGVQNITLVDMDEICVSNINRQLHSKANNIGKLKIEEMCLRLNEINPEVNCTPIFDFFSSSSAASFDLKSFDFVIDAIDSAKNKALLIKMCKDIETPVITIGASGGRMRPECIQINDLRNSVNDKLLKQVKRELRRHHGFSKFEKKPFKVKAVFSSEEANDFIFEHTKDQTPKKNQRSNCQSGLGSASFVTGTFAFHTCAYVINAIIKK